MSELEDIKLKALLQEMKLDSPSNKFTVNVMNQIFQEDNVLEKIKSEKILGKGFWVISILFVLLLFAIFILSGSGIQGESQLTQLLPEASSGVSTTYQSFFEKVGAAPLRIAGILIATSLLLFIERFLSSNSKIFA